MKPGTGTVDFRVTGRLRHCDGHGAAAPGPASDLPSGEWELELEVEPTVTRTQSAGEPRQKDSRRPAGGPT
eukprot:1698129-Rhodomonas_salina.2